uniref:Uncharacterized protein n=1 Tax=Knipowitschia caucasica TaxID=637954 RepID=A0AAV2LYM6_KNICA
MLGGCYSGVAICRKATSSHESLAAVFPNLPITYLQAEARAISQAAQGEASRNPDTKSRTSPVYENMFVALWSVATETSVKDWVQSLAYVGEAAVLPG